MRARACGDARLCGEPQGRAPRSRLSARSHCAQSRSTSILNATAFSARGGDGARARRADAPVLQVVLAGLDARSLARRLSAASRRRSRDACRAAGSRRAHPHPRDLLQGREPTRRVASEFAAVAPRAARRSASPSSPTLAARWAKLRRKATAEKRLACVLSDYPAAAGAPATRSASTRQRAPWRSSRRCCARAMTLHERPPPSSPRSPKDRICAQTDARRLRAECSPHCLAAFPARMRDAWGEPEQRSRLCRDGAFRLSLRALGKLIVAVQPDRGARGSARADYHDSSCAPRHAYVAFYLWLRASRERRRADPSRRAWHAGMAAGQGGGARRGLRAAKSCSAPTAGDLSLHRQQSRRGGAGQAPHRRRSRSAI